MPETFDDGARLEAALASVGAHLVHPETAGWEGPAAPAPRRRPVYVVRVLVAAVALLVALALSVAPVRRAVAGWLGLGSTRVEQVGPAAADPTGLPALRDGAARISAAVAARLLGGPLPDSLPRLGPPEERAAATEGGVLLLWRDGATTLWIRPLPLDGQIYVKKLLGAGPGVRFVSGIGEAAMVIDQAHVLETPDRRVAAGRVVLWIAGGREYRLESELPVERLLEVARAAAAAFVS